MANLIGYLFYDHHAETIHRLAHKSIQAKLATWKGHIYCDLDKDGNAVVSVNGKEIWKGNINK